MRDVSRKVGSDRTVDARPHADRHQFTRQPITALLILAAGSSAPLDLAHTNLEVAYWVFRGRARDRRRNGCFGLVSPRAHASQLLGQRLPADPILAFVNAAAFDWRGAEADLVGVAGEVPSQLDERYVSVRQFREALGMPATLEDSDVVDRAARALVRHGASTADAQG